MASIYLRGRMWYICYYEDGIKVDQSLKTRDKTVAKFKKNEIENKLASGESVAGHKDTPAKTVYQEFIKRCRISNKPATVKYYEDILDPFFNSLPNGISIQRVKPQTIDHYINSKIESKKITQGMVWHIIKVFRTLFNFAKKERFINENPVIRKKPRLPKRLPESWTAAEIKEILNLTKETMIGKAILFNLYVGLRPAELIRLTWKDIDFNSHVLTVQEAKDNEFRKIALHPQAVKTLVNLSQDCHSNTGQVFEGLTFDVMDYQARKIKRQLNLAHIKRFWYAIRHTFATTYYEKTRDLRGLQEILGHSKIEMTTVYVNPNEEHRIEQIRKLEY